MGLGTTFSDSVEGWWLNTWADPESLDLMVFSPEAAPLPSLEFSATTGSHSLGALVMTAAFTEPGQFVDAIVNFCVSSSSEYIYQGLYVESENLVPAEWTKLGLRLTPRQYERFDSAQVIQIGLQVVSAIPNAEPVVLEIDSVRDEPVDVSAE